MNSRPNSKKSMLFSSLFSKSQPVATQLFDSAVDKNRLATAYILAGNALEDKLRLAYELASYVNCTRIKSGLKGACSLADENIAMESWCTNCRWLAKQEHPQALLQLGAGENKSGKIAVEQARLLVEEISKTSPYHRVIVVNEAGQDILHRPAANTLLKTIEEPRTNITMIFCAQSVSDILPTIVSRCQVINMSNNNYKQGKFFSLCKGRTTEPHTDNLLVFGEQEKQNIVLLLEKFKQNRFVDAINLSDNIQTLVKEKENLEIVLDYLIMKELLDLKNIFTDEKETRYAKEIFLLGQIAKEQSKHYVGLKALVETFVFAWYKLRQTGFNPLRIRG